MQNWRGASAASRGGDYLSPKKVRLLVRFGGSIPGKNIASLRVFWWIKAWNCNKGVDLTICQEYVEASKW